MFRGSVVWSRLVLRHALPFALLGVVGVLQVACDSGGANTRAGDDALADATDLADTAPASDATPDDSAIPSDTTPADTQSALDTAPAETAGETSNPPGPTVVSIAPTDGAVDVRIDEPITLRFSEAVDVASLARGIQVTAADVPVPGTWTVAGTAATFRAAGPLEEFGTPHTITVSNAVTNLSGDPLAAGPIASRFVTVVVDPDYAYHLRNAQFPDRLATDPTTGDAYLTASDVATTYWSFTVEGGRYRLQNRGAGADRSLESADGTVPAHLDPSGPSDGQRWSLIAAGARTTVATGESPDLYHLESASQGTERSLGVLYQAGDRLLIGMEQEGWLDQTWFLENAGPNAVVPAVVVPVAPRGPYGSQAFSVPARTNWVNSGLFLRAGESAVIAATGTWSARGHVVSATGDASLGSERGCAIGQLVARSGLRYTDAITCLDEDATFVAPRDGIVYLGMIESTDLGETYQDRMDLDGALDVVVTSTGATVPTVDAEQVSTFPFAEVESGWVELASRHHLVTIEASQVVTDLATAGSALATLDALWEIERDLRGAAPFFEQRVRWFPDDTIASVGYMLAGNPMRCVPELMNGGPNQRILRAAENPTDIWGFAHELGHVFGFVNGTWVYQYNNIESWPNIFTLRALRALGRTAGQPNAGTYCDGRADYLAGGSYETFKTDPFVQLCFLMEFEDTYGPTFYERFFRGMNTQTNDDVGYDGTDASVWRYLRDRFDDAAGEDTTPRWEAWRVPL